MKLESENPSLNLNEFLANVPSYTKFTLELMSKTKWAVSRETAFREFYTKGSSASEPRNFRVFWFPVEKVLNSSHWFCDLFISLIYLSNVCNNNDLFSFYN